MERADNETQLEDDNMPERTYDPAAVSKDVFYERCIQIEHQIAGLDVKIVAVEKTNDRDHGEIKETLSRIFRQIEVSRDAATGAAIAAAAAATAAARNLDGGNGKGIRITWHTAALLVVSLLALILAVAAISQGHDAVDVGRTILPRLHEGAKP